MSAASNAIVLSRLAGTVCMAFRSAVRLRLVLGIVDGAPWLVANRLTTVAGRFCTAINGIKQASPTVYRSDDSNCRCSEKRYATVHPCRRRRYFNFFYMAATHIGYGHMQHTDASHPESYLPIGLALPVIVALSAWLWVVIIEAAWWAGWL
jgi:hypothetical protein